MNYSEKKPVIISIHGVHNADDPTDEPVELVTTGEYSYQNGGAVFSYLESELTGMGHTLTTFEVGRGSVILTRTGDVSSQMIFEEGRKHFSLYETPFGATTIGVDTRSIDNTLNESGGDVEITYSVDVDHALISLNIFKINVREAGKGIVQ